MQAANDRMLVIAGLDQCDSVLVGTSVCLQDRLQSVLSAAARLIRSRWTSEHTAPLLWGIIVVYGAIVVQQPFQRFAELCYGSFTGCASRNESGSGCVFWCTIVCMAQHRHTCLTACVLSVFNKEYDDDDDDDDIRDRRSSMSPLC